MPDASTTRFAAALSTRADTASAVQEACDRALEQLLEGIKSRAVIGEAWQKQFEAFAADLRVHESAENRLLQTALGGDAAEYDEEGNE